MEKLPYQMSERELVVRFLRRRAEFWAGFRQHRRTADLLRREADLIAIGRHDKLNAEQPEH
jgi:hypothetical protein